MPEALCDLLIGGTGLRSISGLYVESWDALLSDGPMVGDNIPIPGMDGVIATKKWRGEYDMPFPVVLLATSKSGQVAILNAISTWAGIATSNVQTLTRRLPSNTTGSVADTTCVGDYQAGLALAAINYVDARTTLVFTNCSGGWS